MARRIESTPADINELLRQNPAVQEQLRSIVLDRLLAEAEVKLMHAEAALAAVTGADPGTGVDPSDGGDE